MNPRRRRHNKRARKLRSARTYRRWHVREFCIFVGGEKVARCSAGVWEYSEGPASVGLIATEFSAGHFEFEFGRDSSTESLTKDKT